MPPKRSSKAKSKGRPGLRTKSISNTSIKPPDNPKDDQTVFPFLSVPFELQYQILKDYLAVSITSPIHATQRKPLRRTTDQKDYPWKFSSFPSLNDPIFHLSPQITSHITQTLSQRSLRLQGENFSGFQSLLRDLQREEHTLLRNSIKILEFAGCQDISAKGFEDLRKTFPNVKTIVIYEYEYFDKRHNESNSARDLCFAFDENARMPELRKIRKVVNDSEGGQGKVEVEFRHLATWKNGARQMRRYRVAERRLKSIETEYEERPVVDSIFEYIRERRPNWRKLEERRKREDRERRLDNGEFVVPDWIDNMW